MTTISYALILFLAALILLLILSCPKKYENITVASHANKQAPVKSASPYDTYSLCYVFLA